MANRTTKVTLVASVNGYLNEMDKAAQKTRELGTAAEKLAAQREALGTFGQGLLAVGAVAAASFGLAVARSADFDAALSNVKAATQESAENMGLLREAALEAGASTVFTATEAANAIEELGKAGLTTEQILSGGLDGALSLAAAGQLEVAEAAQIAAIAVKQFNLEGSDVPHVADLLAAGAGEAVGDVKDLSAALGQAGLVANGAGQTIEDTTGVLAAFADAGLLGSDAGTSLKSAIIALQAPTARAQAEMDKYNLTFYDGNQQMLSYDEIAGQLKDNLGGLGDEERNAALARIFGNDALRVANVLYDEGAAGIQKYIDQTNDSGYAAKVAADRLDNLKGDVEKLGGAFDTVLIRSGSGANDSLRLLTQTATGLVDAFGDIPQPVLDTGLALGVAAGAVGLVGGAALLAVPKVAAFKVGLSTLGVSGKTAATGLTAATGAVAAATIAFALFAAEQAQATATTQEFADSLDPATGAITDYTREILAKKLAESGAFDAARDVGISQRDLTDAVIEGGDELEKYRAKIGGNTALWKLFTEEGLRAGGALDGITKATEGLESGEQVFRDVSAAADENADSTQDAATAYQDAASTAADLESNLSTLIDTINKANGVGQDAVTSNAAYQDALQDVRDTLADIDPATGKAREGAEAFKRTLDESTPAGAANAAMLADLAAKSQAAAQAALDAGGSSDDYTAALGAGRQAIYDTAFALSGNAQQAQALTDKIYAMPTAKEIAVTTTAARAIAEIDTLATRIRNLNGVSVPVAIANSAELRGIGRAAGGAVYGPGSATSDSIPARLSNGEHVFTAAEVARMGGHGEVYKFRRELQAPTYVAAAPHYANGGAVTGGGNTERPIYMDGSLFGVLKEVANGEAQIVVNVNSRQQVVRASLGSRR